MNKISNRKKDIGFTDVTRPTALVTGITGQCGSYLVELLLEKKYNVVGIRRRTATLNTQNIEHLNDNPNFIQEWGDLNDSYSLFKIVTKYKPQFIFNAAAQSHVAVSFEVPEETLNITGMGVMKLLNVMKEVVPDAKFFQFSSSEMFGTNAEIPQRENSPMMPASPYACSKLFAHHLCRNYREAYGLNIVCGIIFNNEGPRRGETFVTRKITQAAARIKLGKQEKLFLGNLEAKRDWGYTPEYMDAIIKLMETDVPPDDYIIATGETHTVREFLEEVFNVAGLKIEDHVVINPNLYRPQEVPILCGDSTKLQKTINWYPKTKMKELAKIMYASDFESELGL